LIEEAETLGITPVEGQVSVIAGDRLADWASRFPALAVSQLLGGPGHGVVDFAQWSSSRRHQTRWVEDDSRHRQIEQIRADLFDNSKVDIRIHGHSGSGKTRLVMEALRGSGLTELVAYVPDERDVSPEILYHALQPHRATILVVDECTGRRHDKLVERLMIDCTLKLITIGETDEYRLEVPILEVGALPPDELDQFLILNHPELSAETRRVVIEQSGGNVRLADLLAVHVIRSAPDTVAELIQTKDVQRFLALVLPEGRQHFLASVLALFERVGWEDDLESELESILNFAGATLDEYIELDRDLRAHGVLERRGRFRAVTPHPLAVGLAAELWRTNPVNSRGFGLVRRA
jgi:hypothetical protein